MKIKVILQIAIITLFISCKANKNSIDSTQTLDKNNIKINNQENNFRKSFNIIKDLASNDSITIKNKIKSLKNEIKEMENEYDFDSASISKSFDGIAFILIKVKHEFNERNYPKIKSNVFNTNEDLIESFQPLEEDIFSMESNGEFLEVRDIDVNDNITTKSNSEVFKAINFELVKLEFKMELIAYLKELANQDDKKLINILK